MHKLNKAGGAVAVLLVSMVMLAGVASAAPPPLPDPSDTADDFLATNAPEAVAIILAIGTAAVLFALIKRAVTGTKSVVAGGGK